MFPRLPGTVVTLCFIFASIELHGISGLHALFLTALVCVCFVVAPFFYPSFLPDSAFSQAQVPSPFHSFLESMIYYNPCIYIHDLHVFNIAGVMMHLGHNHRGYVESTPEIPFALSLHFLYFHPLDLCDCPLQFLCHFLLTLLLLYFNCSESSLSVSHEFDWDAISSFDYDAFCQLSLAIKIKKC